MLRSRRSLLIGSLVGIVCLLLGLCLFGGYRIMFLPAGLRKWLFPPGAHRLERPYGMAPAAYQEFVLACDETHIHPFRIAQTIGNHPRSHGYHFKDGTVSWHGQKFDYTTALDMDVSDLSRPKINQFLENMGRCGFAAYYREGPNWRGDEHVHAVYAGLPMKHQLRKQVREWVEQRKEAKKKNFSWEGRWRHFWDY